MFNDMFEGLNPEELESLEKVATEKAAEKLRFDWHVSDSVIQSGALLGKIDHYDMRLVDLELKEAISKMCEWQKGGDEKFYQLGRQYLRMGLALTTVIEDLQSLFTAVASEYGD